jgi:hypothetical protein
MSSFSELDAKMRIMRDMPKIPQCERGKKPQSTPRELLAAKTEEKLCSDILAFTKEGVLMRIRHWFPVLAFTAVTFLVSTAGGVRAGSFFGPCCYGSSYAYEYPNRAHNVFGCGPCSQCTARHPLFGHLFHKNRTAPVDGLATPAPLTAVPPLAPRIEAVPAPGAGEPMGKAPF